MTPGQFNALAFIADGIARSGWSPSIQEIADHVGLASKSGAHRIVSGLLEAGLICRLPRQTHRNLDVTETGRTALARRVAA